MSDDSDIENKTGQRRKRPLNPATPSESSDSGNSLVTSKRSRKQLVVKSDDESSDSENEEIIAVRPGLKRKTPKIQSDYETGESNNENEDLLTDTSESSSGDENDSSCQATSGKKNLECLVCESSSDSDGQSEKCPICLAKFVDQEIGTPEACDHFFCATCIQEWAKNVNTCPVDRQPFTLILVRQQLDGKVFRQIPVNVPTVSIEVPEDATFCEVCGLSDREDRMLLCDACDHGYHMECLNPPLDHVPIDEWYCPECAPRRATMRRSAGISRGVHREEEPASEGNEIQTRDRPRPRMVPRTRHSERVRTTLRNRRVNIAPSINQPITSSGVDSMEGESNPLRRRTTQRRNRVKKRQSRFRIKTIVTDDGVIEVVLKRKRRKKYRKRKNRTVRSAPRSVKGRLANKLGMCKPRVTNQMIPETLNRQELISAPINHQRHQAGIPTLDIFGRRDQLDYFSGTDDENGMESLEGGVGFMVRARVSRTNDHLINRKKAATILSSKSIRKPLKVETFTSPPTTNLLDSILNSQTLWHSKKMEIKSKSDGSVRVIIPKGSKTEIFKEDKIDVRNTVAPVVQTPMFPGGRGDTGTYKQDYSNKGGVGNTQSANRSGSEQTCTESSSFQSSSSGGGASYSKYESSVGPSPLRGVAPIRFRMNIPPRRPNIHSYPTDNIPPPPPLRLRLPVAEVSFPPTNSPEASPTKEEEEIDIYSDIEQETNANENELEEKSFGVMEPPPEPPFLMTMEPPPEPPAILMNINDDASDDEPSGLVIDDPLQNETYDPCAINSDDSSTDNAPLSKPPEVPVALKTPDLVADYSSNSCPNMETPPYNPELPTYLNTPIIGPLPRPASHKTSEAEESDDECPNFSMYSAASMNLAHRGLTLPIPNLDIPIPPTIEEDPNVKENFDDIPLPDSDSPKSNVKYDSLDIPIPEELGNEDITECDKKLTVHASNHNKNSKNFVSTQKSTTLNDQIEELEKQSLQSDEDTEEHDQVESDDDDDDDDDDGGEADDDSDDQSVQEEPEKNIKSKIVKTKGSSEAGEDECSTQGDVLDLAIESEANLENNIPHDDSEEQHRIDLVKSPPELDEISEKVIDSGDKSDGLVDITDEEMSVYDGQDNGTDFEKLNEQVIEEMQHRKNESKPLDSDDDNSLVGGATSAVSAGTLNNSDNIQPPTLPGLEGLETETISESEDVNFDELPMEGNEQHEILISDEDLISSRKKRKKKYRKISHTEDGKGNEPLEFEEGEIIEDKPKQVLKKDKKSKATPDNEVKTDDIVEINKQKTAFVEKEPVEKKSKKKKDKSSTTKDKNDKNKELKEKLLKPGEIDENISWKKLSRSNKERNYRDGKERDEKDKDRENKDEVLSKKEKRNKERRKELERYNVRRLISEKPKRPKKDEFGRDISPSKSGSSLSPYRPPRYRSPLRTRNRSRTRSKSWKSRSRSRGRRRQNRSRERLKSHERSRRSHSRERSRKRSRSRDKIKSRERRKTPDQDNTIKKARTSNRSPSWTRKKSRSPNSRRRSASYSRSWTPSWSKSSVSRSRSRGRRKSRSVSRTKSRSWTREQNVASLRRAQKKNPPKNLTVIVTNKEALKKKEKRKPSKKKDDRRKKKRGQSPVPSKEVFTSGDNILVSVNFKNANKNPELIPASTPLLRESSKRKRDDTDSSAKKKKLNSSSKKSPGVKKSNRLAKINEVARNAKPVAIIDLDLSPFREQTPSPKEVIVLSDSGDEGDKQHSEVQDEINRLGHSAITQSMLSLSSIDHGQKNSLSQPESPLSSSFLLNSSGPKTPPEPHIKFSISTKPSQIRLLTNPLMETEEEMQDENIENDEDEILHKGPNTPPEPPPDLNTPASPPTTPYDPFDPTKSRSPSPQPRNNEIGQLNTTREDKLENLQNDDNDHQRLAELRTSTPPNEPDDLKKTPEITKVHSTPKSDPNNTDTSPKVSPPIGISESNKIGEDTLMKPIPKLLAGTNKADVTIVHKSPEKLASVVSQQVKNSNQTPKQTSQPLKTTTPNKHQTPKSNAKHQLFSSSLLKQVPILGTLSLLSGAPTYTPSVGLNSNNKMSSRLHQNGDPSDDMDIDPSSPYSPGSSEGDDLFEPPIATPPRSSSKPAAKTKPSSGNKFDSLFGTSPAKPKHGKHTSKTTKKGSSKLKSKGNKKEEVKVKLDEDQLKILEDMPSSAVEMQVKDKFLKKLNRQERVVEEVKLVLKPHYAKKHINKEDYKEILRRAVPKICHNKSGEINPIKIQYLIEAYVKKFRYAKKKASGAVSAPVQMKPKPQKTLWS